MKLGQRASAPQSGIREMLELAAQIPDAIHLEVGDPDFTTPQHIIDAAYTAASGGFTRYTSSRGLLSLREAAAVKASTQNGIACTAENIVITTGAAGGLFNLLMVLLSDNDEVLVPDPGFAAYPSMVALAGGVSRTYAAPATSGFLPSPATLEDSITENTRGVIINSPNNPTGAVYGVELLRELVGVAEARGIWVISDECYEDLIFTGEHHSPASLATNGLETVASVFSFSKSYAMTGWRVGYVVAETPLADAIARTQESMVACVSSVSQKAAEAALVGSRRHLEQMSDTYAERRSIVQSKLEAQGVPFNQGDGAFYAMISVESAGLTSQDFALRLLSEKHVTVTPGSAFGPGGEGFIRISIATPTQQLELGLDAIVDMLGY